MGSGPLENVTKLVVKSAPGCTDPVAASVTPAAKTVRVTVSPSAKGASGVSVKLTGPPDTAAVWAPLSSPERVNEAAEKLTASLKVKVTGDATGTLTAPGAGVA